MPSQPLVEELVDNIWLQHHKGYTKLGFYLAFRHYKELQKYYLSRAERTVALDNQIPAPKATPRSSLLLTVLELEGGYELAFYLMAKWNIKKASKMIEAYPTKTKKLLLKVENRLRPLLRRHRLRTG